jgi:hypothetical protein
MQSNRPLAFVASLMLIVASDRARADDAPLSLDLTIQNHVWKPAELDVPAGKHVVINIKNLDPTAEEFDSDDLKVEKIVPGNGAGVVRLHGLDAGRYSFMGEYHPATAQGVVVAK